MKGALLAARERLLLCSQSQCPAPIMKDCASWLNEVEESLSSVVFAVTDALGRDIPDGRVSSNQRVVAERTDGRAVVLDPGTYTFAFEVPGYERLEQTLSVRQSEKNRIVRVQLQKPASARIEPAQVASEAVAKTAPATMPQQPAPVREPEPPFPVATVILGGTALAAVGSAAFFGLQGQAKLGDWKQCQPGCEQTRTSGLRDYWAANISWGIAGAAAVSAILVYIFAESKPIAPKPARSSQLRRPAAF